MKRPPGEPEAGGPEANRNQQEAELVVLTPEWYHAVAKRALP